MIHSACHCCRFLLCWVLGVDCAKVPTIDLPALRVEEQGLADRLRIGGDPVRHSEGGQQFQCARVDGARAGRGMARRHVIDDTHVHTLDFQRQSRREADGTGTHDQHFAIKIWLGHRDRLHSDIGNGQ